MQQIFEKDRFLRAFLAAYCSFASLAKELHVVLPGMWHDLCTQDSRLIQRLINELALTLTSFSVAVSFYEKTNQSFFNSIAIFDADGTNLGIYRKSHIPDGPG